MNDSFDSFVWKSVAFTAELHDWQVTMASTSIRFKRERWQVVVDADQTWLTRGGVLVRWLSRSPAVVRDLLSLPNAALDPLLPSSEVEESDPILYLFGRDQRPARPTKPKKFIERLLPKWQRRQVAPPRSQFLAQALAEIDSMDVDRGLKQDLKRPVCLALSNGWQDLTIRRLDRGVRFSTHRDGFCVTVDRVQEESSNVTFLTLDELPEEARIIRGSARTEILNASTETIATLLRPSEVTDQQLGEHIRSALDSSVPSAGSH